MTREFSVGYVRRKANSICYKFLFTLRISNARVGEVLNQADQETLAICGLFFVFFFFFGALRAFLLSNTSTIPETKAKKRKSTGSMLRAAKNFNLILGFYDGS